VADHDAAAQPKGVHRGRDVERVLAHAVTGGRLVGLTPAAKVEGEKRPPAGEPFGDADEVDV
jgi:hypothetical protein